MSSTTNLFAPIFARQATYAQKRRKLTTPLDDGYTSGGASASEPAPPPNAPSSSDDDGDDLTQAPAQPSHHGRTTSSYRPRDYFPRYLRRQHLDNLTAVLYKCLLTSEYERASRAFALILRCPQPYPGLDLRSHNLWGIGTEILLRRRGTGEGQQPGRDPQRTDRSGDGSPPRDAQSGDLNEQHNGQTLADPAATTTLLGPGFTSAGQRDARRFLERFILQYPYVRHRPRDVNDLQFYPVFFGIWILEMQGRIDASLHEARQSQSATASDTSGKDEDASAQSGRSSSSESREGESDMSGMDNNSGTPQRTKVNKRLGAAVAPHLEEVAALVNRIEELITTTPYDRNAQLLRLHRGLCLWRADLHSRYDKNVAPSLLKSWRNAAQRSLQRAEKYNGEASKT